MHYVKYSLVPGHAVGCRRRTGFPVDGRPDRRQRFRKFRDFVTRAGNLTATNGI